MTPVNVTQQINNAIGMAAFLQFDNIKKLEKVMARLIQDFTSAFRPSYGLIHIDAITRSLEDEFNNIDQFPINDTVFRFENLIMFSELWIVKTYELMRVCSEMIDGNQCSQNVHSNEVRRIKDLKLKLELVRMPIAKFEIRGINRRRNKDFMTDDLKLKLMGSEHLNGKYFADRYYDDEQKGVIWNVYNIERCIDIEISRRTLSDDFMSIFDC